MNRIASRLMGAMKVACVVEEGVIGRQIGASSEPPHRPSLEVAVIEVNRRDVGVTRMEHHRGSRCKPGMPLRLRTLLKDRWGQFFPLNLREIHATLFKDAALTHHTGASPAPFWPDPTFFGKAAFTIKRFQTRTDLVLQTHHHCAGPISGIAGGELQRGVADTHVLASEDAANQGADHVSETEDIET